MENSQKIIEILNSGHNVRVLYKHIDDIFYDYNSDGFITLADGKKTKPSSIDWIDKKSITIAPIYKKPKWKIGDLVNIAPDLGWEEADRIGFKIIDVTAWHITCDKDGTTWHDVPYWAISPHFKD